MNNNYSNTDILIDYIDNNLTGEEKIKVDAMLQNNSTLKTEFDNLVLAKSALAYYGIKQQVKLIHKEVMEKSIATEPLKNEQAVVKTMIKWSMRIAASLLIIVCGLGVYQYATISSDKLYSENFTSYTMRVTRGEADATALVKDFNEKDYEGTIKQYAVLDNIQQKENFIVALAYLETNKYNYAIEAFNAVLEKNSLSKEKLYNDDAEYFLAMSYLKNNNIVLAMPIFERINNNSNHLYNDKVTNSFMRKLKLLSWKN